MRNHNLVSYETIVRATSGEPEAVEEYQRIVDAVKADRGEKDPDAVAMERDLNRLKADNGKGEYVIYKGAFLMETETVMVSFNPTIVMRPELVNRNVPLTAETYRNDMAEVAEILDDAIADGFLTENDVMEKRLPLYPIERCFLGTGERFGDGSHILYVNGAYRGDTPIGKLMHDFSCTDAADMYYGTLADRVRFFKESKEGIEIMCRAMEDMRNQTLKEGMINVAKKMLEDGTITLEKIAEFVGLSVDEVRKLKTDQNM